MIESNVHKIIDRRTGETIFPGTVTDGVAHLQTRTDLNTLITEYDLTRIWPDLGTDNEGAYNLEQALSVISEKLKGDQKVLGVTIKFLGEKDTSKEEGEQRHWEIWKYYDVRYGFSDPLGWIRLEMDTLLELEKDSYYRVTLNIQEGKSLIEVGQPVGRVEITWSAYYREEPVTNQCVCKFNGADVLAGSRGTIVDVDTFTTHKELFYTLEANYHKMKRTATAKIIGVHPSYIGVVESSFNPTTEQYIKGDCTKVLISDRSYFLIGDGLSYQKICYAYPTYFGELSEIEDKIGIDWVDSFTRSTIIMNGTDYYVYVLNSPVTIEKDFKLTFR